MSSPAEERAELTATQVLALYAAYSTGGMTQPDFQRQAAVALFAGKIMASRLADIVASSFANRRPLGITPGQQHLERLSEAVESILEPVEAEADLEPTQRLERLAIAETLNSYRKTLHRAITDQGFPEWVRVVAEDACEICAPLAGEVLPVTVGFRDHPGCRCSLEPHGEPTQQIFEEQEEPVIRISKGVRRGT